MFSMLFSCNYFIFYLLCLFFFFVYLLFYYFFFFSSRRRHTRYIGDWSSDVCSSDLIPTTQGCHSERSEVHVVKDSSFSLLNRQKRDASLTLSMTPRFLRLKARGLRSEERRVGKECRSRWWACKYKEKKKESTMREGV